MLNIPPETFRRAQSAAWITPAGEFEGITGEMIHDDLSAYFPGVPTDEDYPSNFAVNQLGYVKVSNPFEILWSGERDDHRGRSIDRDAQFETMADFTAGALIHYKKRGIPNWVPGRGDPTEWEMRALQPGRPISRTTVGDFVERYGSRETGDRMYAALGMSESRIRSLVREMLSEGRSSGSRFLDEDRKLILAGWII